MNTFEKRVLDETTTSEGSWEKSLNTSSNTPANKSLTEIVNSSKKDISYIFKLNATKRELERINKKIEKLLDKATDLNAMITENHRLYIVLEKHYYDVYIKRQEMLSAFQQSLKLHGVNHVNQVIDPHHRDKFLKRFSKPEENKNMSDILDSLYISFLNTGVQQSVLQDINQKMLAAQKEIANLDKQFDDNQKLLDEKIKQFADIDAEWLLKSYELSWSKVSIQDFVAPSEIKKQMERLITIYNNLRESKFFWVSKPKGILFVGGPETGKTFAAKVFASEIDRKMYHIQAHDLFSEDIADPNEMLYIIFYNIIDYVQKTKESCIIFLDEIEKIVDSMWEYNPADRKMISNTIIKNIINIQKSNLDIILLAALWHRNRIDERFLKYDLFDSQFFFELPKEEERKRLFHLYIQKAEKRAKTKLFATEIIDELAKKTELFSAEYIKQLINSCVREYLYAYIQNKDFFTIKSNFISSKIKDIAKWISEKRLKSPLELPQRKKILSTLIDQYTMKDLIFWELIGDKKSKLLDYILEHTNLFTGSELTTLMQDCFDEYQKRKTEYQEKSLIDKDFILDKIEELRCEDKKKWKSLYFSNK